MVMYSSVVLFGSPNRAGSGVGSASGEEPLSISAAEGKAIVFGRHLRPIRVKPLVRS